MMVDNINNIIINLDNNKTIIADNKMFSNLYISNIDNNGDEIPYVNTETNSLISNFFMIKLKNKIIEYNLTNKQLEENAFNLIKNEKNIESIIINFKNGKSIPFILNSNNVIKMLQKTSLLTITPEKTVMLLTITAADTKKE